MSRQLERLPERYEPGPLVGSGAMGSVWRALDRVLGVAVAVKVPHAAIAGSTRGRSLFEREVRAVAAVVHPHLVPLHDWGRLDDGTPFLAMAWADGGSLETPPATWAGTRDRIAEVLMALAALHARGIVHRDLKPANVLLHGGRAWVADLGLAAAMDELGRGPARIEGTPRYMAPEQRQGRVREIGPATDLFAVGAILDELTRGQRVPGGLDDLLAVLLHPDPLGRYDLAADALRALLALGEPAVVRPAGAPMASLDTLTIRTRLADSATYTTVEGAPAEGAPIDDVPPWNRPEAPSFPAEPPDEPRDRTHRPASVPLFALREPPLVGRDALRARLWSAASGVLASGKPAVVVLCGEPGSGKTRIVESAARALEAGGHAEITRVRHLAGGGPDHGFEGAARRLVRGWDEPRDVLRARVGRWLMRDGGPGAAALVPAVCGWAGIGADDGPAADPRLGTKLVLDHLRARGWRGIAALVADDAHHDPDTLDVLHGLLVRASLGEALPIVIFVTCDPQRLDGAGRRALDRLVAAGAERIEVPRLDRSATRELVEVLLPLSANVAEWLAQRCEGNPRLARQILQYWADRGALADAGQLVLTAAPGVSLDAMMPPDAAAAYLARLDSTDVEATASALVALAAAGEAFPEAVFTALAGPCTPVLLASGLIRLEEGWCRWEHAVVASAVRARLDERADREALLDGAAEAWFRYGALSGRPAHAQVGLLRLAAGRPADALGPLLRACDDAMAANLTREHDRCGEAALVALGGAGEHAGGLDAARVRFHAATAKVRRGLVQEAVTLGLAARDGFLAAEAWGEAADTIVVLRGAFNTLGERERSQACVDELRAMAERLRDPAVAAAALRAEARSLLNRGRSEAAVPLLQRLAEAERARGCDHEEIRALHDLARALSSQGHLDAAREAGLQALALARRRGTIVTQAPALHVLGQIATLASQPDEAQRYLEQALELSVVSRDELRTQVVVGDLAQVAQAKGDFVRARAGFQANLAYSTALNLRQWELVDRWRLAVVTLEAGDTGEALAHADRLEALAAEVGEGRAAAWPAVIRLAAAVMQGDRRSVAAQLDAWAPPGALDAVMSRRMETGAFGAAARGWAEEAMLLARIASEAWLRCGRPEAAQRLAALAGDPRS